MVQSLAFVSGKGGVGKTSLAINSAINLSLNGFSVAVLDADFGMSNANILMDVKADKTISDVLSGECALEDIIRESHAGVKLIPGGSGTLDTLNLDTEQRWKIIRSLDVLEEDLDFLIVGTPAGASNSSIEFVNMAKNEAAALRDFKSFEKIALMFLPVNLNFIGWMPGSNDIVQSIIARKPFILDKKTKKAVGQCMDVITKNIQETLPKKRSGVQFFSSGNGV